ncbi:hypothetical protein HDV05_002001 [Chytridiales sp. JEL 0842]|nr:hypothetical protein HDV05_002001 [Chytridiales sp. JEL 0842]
MLSLGLSAKSTTTTAAASKALFGGSASASYPTPFTGPLTEFDFGNTSAYSAPALNNTGNAFFASPETPLLMDATTPFATPAAFTTDNNFNNDGALTEMEIQHILNTPLTDFITGTPLTPFTPVVDNNNNNSLCGSSPLFAPLAESQSLETLFEETTAAADDDDALFESALAELEASATPSQPPYARHFSSSSSSLASSVPSPFFTTVPDFNHDFELFAELNVAPPALAPAPAPAAAPAPAPIAVEEPKVSISLKDLQALLSAVGQPTFTLPTPPTPTLPAPLTTPSTTPPSTTNGIKKKRRPSKVHPCPHCPRTFTRHFNLKTHIPVHFPSERPRPFTCPHSGCAKNFVRIYDLDRHLVTHEEGAGEKWKCGGCGRGFGRRDALRRHCAGRRGVEGGCFEAEGNEE